ncbi:MAG: PEP-CTERM sorting domain-containing protein [Puniceicoccales bacterium]|nr:PEP-CTERM sorting domain-containing protein [Puniceicoccales bacterium]
MTAIPEPSTYALVGGVLALSLVLVVRRRKN